MPKPTKEPVQIFQLKVTLRQFRPPIWRRIQVPGDITLYKLHQIVQLSMGWTNSHLHQFTIHGVSYGETDPDLRIVNERRYRLNQLVSEVKEHFAYEYDFGDCWEHDILVEKILAPESGVHYPCCIKGKRACPPEDVGGVWGYADFLEALQDPAHPEHEDMIEWLGEEFDPEAFDLDKVNAYLRQL